MQKKGGQMTTPTLTPINHLRKKTGDGNQPSHPNPTNHSAIPENQVLPSVTPAIQSEIPKIQVEPPAETPEIQVKPPEIQVESLVEHGGARERATKSTATRLNF
jgi:hypothetical protein